MNNNMNALIRTTEASSNLVNNINTEKYGINEAIKLLKQHIEDFIFREQEVVVCISSKGSECRHAFYIEDYTFEEDYLNLNSGNYELHIDFNEDVQVKYNNDFEESFTIVLEHEKIILYFMN